MSAFDPKRTLINHRELDGDRKGRVAIGVELIPQSLFHSRSKLDAAGGQPADRAGKLAGVEIQYPGGELCCLGTG